MQRIIVTGGAGFIGSAVVRTAIAAGHAVINVDSMTYAASLMNVESVANSENYSIEIADIRNRDALDSIFDHYQPTAVIHLAAETHVDRSIDDPSDFISTNVVGTFNMLEAARNYWRREKKLDFVFLHVSTDEVFGELGPEGKFTEDTPYAPNSPYSASKAGADHLARAWFETYGLPVIVTNCSNNYGPFQNPEKLIPHTILRGLRKQEIPVYGDGRNVRDWLHVEDHASALLTVMELGTAGRSYNIGGDNELSNIVLVRQICAVLDELRPIEGSHADLIRFVTDRPGHDYRYAIDNSRIKAELKWQPKHTVSGGVRETVKWYLENPDWCTEALQRSGPLARKGLAA